MKIRIIVLLLIVTACAPAPTLETPTPVLETPTPTSTATPTSEPTATSVPTPTVAPPYVFPTRGTTRVNLIPLPELPAPPSTVKFIYDDGVTQDKQIAIQNGLSLAQAIWGEVGPINVFSYVNLDALLEEERHNYGWPIGSSLIVQSRRRWEQNRVCETSVGIIFCYVTPAEPPAGARLHIPMIHEYFHRIQDSLSKNARAQGPLWLIEGSAEYAMVTMAARYGFADVEAERADYILHSRGISRGLSAIETAAGADNEDSYSVYSLGFLAAELLAMNAGDQAVLKNYWEYLGAGLGWQVAFEKAFGVTVSDFYRRFDEYRAAEFPVDCDYWGHGSFGVQYHRAMAPGSIPNTSGWVPYVFCVTGFALTDLSAAQKTAAFKLPNPSAWRISCGSNCVIILMNKDLSKGNYTLGFELSDGRKAQTSFQHQ